MTEFDRNEVKQIQGRSQGDYIQPYTFYNLNGKYDRFLKKVKAIIYAYLKVLYITLLQCIDVLYFI